MELFRFQINAISFSIFSRVNTRTNDMRDKRFARASRKLINIDGQSDFEEEPAREIEVSARLRGLQSGRNASQALRQSTRTYWRKAYLALHYLATKKLPCAAPGVISSVWPLCSLSRIFCGKYENTEKSAVRGSGAYEIKPLPRHCWSEWPRRNQRNMVRPFQTFVYLWSKQEMRDAKGHSAKERISDSKISEDLIKMIFFGMQSWFWKKIFSFFSSKKWWTHLARMSFNLLSLEFAKLIN